VAKTQDCQPYDQSVLVWQQGLGVQNNFF